MDFQTEAKTYADPEKMGKVISVVRIETDKFQEWKNIMPFYRNIQDEGVLLWQAA